MNKTVNPGFDFDSINKIYLIYISSYKKYRYWFRIFYILSILLFLLLYNTEIAHKINLYKLDQEIIKNKSEIQFFIGSNDTLNAINIEKYLFNKFRYYPYNYKNGTSWEGIQNQLQKYNKIIYLADSLDLITDSYFSNNILEYKNTFYSDTLKIENAIDKFDSKLKTISTSGNRRQSFVRDTLKPAFIDSFNNNVITNYIELIPISRIVPYLIKKYNINNNIFTKDISYNIFGKAKLNIIEIEKWKKKQIIDINNFKIPFAFDTIKYYAIAILLILLTFLHLHYLNFIFYEKRITKLDQPLVKVSTLKNIIINLEIPILSNLYIIIGITFLINIILPFLLVALISTKVWYLLDNYFPFYIPIFLSLIFYLILIIYLFKQNKHDK